MNENEKNWICEYYQQIQDGTVTVGRYVRLLYAYLVKGLADGLFFFDAGKANAPIEWIEKHCFHTQGPLAPSPLQLELWQKAMLSAVFGIVDQDGLRQFRESCWWSAERTASRFLQQRSRNTYGKWMADSVQLFTMSRRN